MDGLQTAVIWMTHAVRLVLFPTGTAVIGDLQAHVCQTGVKAIQSQTQPEKDVQRTRDQPRLALLLWEGKA